MTEQVLVVIGVGGIGTAIARRSGTGRRLVLADRDRGALSDLGAALTSEGYSVTTQAVDITDPGSVQTLAETSLAAGDVTGVVHTSGDARRPGDSDRVMPVTDYADKTTPYRKGRHSE